MVFSYRLRIRNQQQSKYQYLSLKATNERDAVLEAFEVYKDIAEHGSQANSIEKMQTRDELYEYLNYHSFEQKLDELFKRKENK